MSPNLWRASSAVIVGMTQRMTGTAYRRVEAVELGSHIDDLKRVGVSSLNYKCEMVRFQYYHVELLKFDQIRAVASVASRCRLVRVGLDRMHYVRWSPCQVQWSLTSR